MKLRGLTGIMAAVMITVCGNGLAVNAAGGEILSYDFESSTVIAEDMSGKTHHGAVLGEHNFVKQPDGNTYISLSNCGKINVLDSDELRGMDTLSISFWTKVNQRPTMADAGIHGIDMVCSDGAYRIRMNCFGAISGYVGTEQGGWYNTPDTGIASGNDAIGYNTWAHVVLQYDGTKMEMYINGVKIGESDVSLGGKIVGKKTLVIGSSDDPEVMSCYDDIKISTELMTAAEITAAAAKAPMAKDSDITIDIPFDGSGSDVSGNGINASGAVQFINGADKQAARMTNSSAAEITNSSAIYGMDQFTASMWARIDSTPKDGNNNIFLIEKDGSYRLLVDYYGWLTCIVATENNSWYSKTIYTEKGAFKPGRWNHVAITYDGATVQLYLNGQAVGHENGAVGSGAFTGKIAPSGGNLKLGYSNEASRTTDIDSFKMRSRALSAAEIKAEYDSTANGRELVRLSYDSLPEITDETGNGNVIDVSAAVSDDGVIGTSAKLTDAGRAISVANAPGHSVMNELTLATWIKLPDTKGSYVTLFGKYLSYDFSVNPNRTLMINHKTSGESIVTQGTLPSDGWAHVALVYDGAEYSIYINGVKQETTGAITTPGALGSEQAIYIGDAGNAAERWFDESVIIDGALSDEEIAMLATIPKDEPKPENEFAVSNLTLTDGVSEQEAKTVSRGIYIPGFNAVNTTTEDKTVNVMTAEYAADTGILTGISVTPVTIPSGTENTTYTLAPLMIKDGANKQISVFCWDNLDNGAVSVTGAYKIK